MRFDIETRTADTWITYVESVTPANAARILASLTRQGETARSVPHRPPVCLACGLPHRYQLGDGNACAQPSNQ